jgi:hypothetical protein
MPKLSMKRLALVFFFINLLAAGFAGAMGDLQKCLIRNSAVG